MKWTLLLLAAVLLTDEVSAQAWVKYVPENPAYPGQCFDNSTGVAHPAGDQWSAPGECFQLSCDREGDQLLITGAGCGIAEEAEPPCRSVTPSVSLRFPLCCPRVECP